MIVSITPAYGDTGPNSSDELTELIITEINHARTDAGRPPLALNQDLMNDARLRASEVSGFFSHTRPNGEFFNSVFSMRGYAAGENIVYLNTSPGHSDDQRAKLAVNAWMESKPHHDNLLYTGWVETGLGIYSSGNETYIVQLFIAY